MAASQSLLLFMVMVMFFGLVRCADSVNKPRPLIVGGAPISIVEAPWMAALFYDDRLYCGSSILSDQWILTAAHCTSKHAAARFKVLVGTHSLTNGGHKYSVDKVVVHEQYNGVNFVNDISVMRTKSRMNLDGNPARAVTLPAPGAARPPAGTTLKVIGWGKTEDGSLPNDLRAVDIQIQDFSQCQVFAVTDETTQICAFLLHKDSCNGDSGGPLVSGNIQQAVVSYGQNETCGGHASVYTYLEPYREWIKDHTGV